MILDGCLGVRGRQGKQYSQKPFVQSHDPSPCLKWLKLPFTLIGHASLEKVPKPRTFNGKAG
jgi:hypothetical protein